MRTLFICLAVLAVICWALGAYRRLLRLRAGIRTRLAEVDEAVRAECTQWQSRLPAALESVEQAQEPEDEHQAAPAQAEGADVQEQGGEQIQMQGEEGEAAMVRRSWMAAVQQLDAALVQARRDPLNPMAMAVVSTALQVFEQSLSHCKSFDVYADSRLQDSGYSAIPEDLMKMEIKRAEAIEAFNCGVAIYNGAVRTWPARALALFLRFREAGSIGPLTEQRQTP